MGHVFKIKKYWILTTCMLICSMTLFAQDCPPIIGIIKPVTTIPPVCQANVIAIPASQTISTGQTTSITLTSTAVGTTFSWTVIQTNLTGATIGTGNTINQTLTNTGVTSGTAIYTITPQLGSCLGTPIKLTINVENYKNNIKSGSFVRNNCGAGGTGSTVTYTIAANTYTSTISQADADAQAQIAVNNGGLAYANANGTCTYSFGNVAKSGLFTRNNCGAGGAGSTVTYTVPSNTYTSSTSQADADAQAQNVVNTNGQEYANINGACTYSFGNAAISGSFTRNNCGFGGTGSTVTYTIAANTYTSTTSQADADAQAQIVVNNGGQAYANANGTCTYSFGNVAQSGSFTRNNCGTGGTGSTVTYTVPANTYSSTSSQADADAQAQNAVNANGQIYANTNGTCSYWFGNSVKSGSFVRNNCGAGGTGSTVTYTIAANTYTSTTSQADADAQAQTAVNNGGQAYTNANGTCSYNYQFSSPGKNSSSSACSETSHPVIFYSTSSTLGIGTQVYLDSNLATPVLGNNLWYKSSVGNFSYRVDNNRIVEMVECEPPIVIYRFKAAYVIGDPEKSEVYYLDQWGQEQTVQLPREYDTISAACVEFYTRSMYHFVGVLPCEK
jgi:20S proteasome alpha/beta subunit